MSLLREEVYKARLGTFSNEILLARPLTVTMLTLAASVIATIIVSFFVFAEYSRKERLTGRVELSQGVSKVYSPVVGIVSERFATEGQTIRKGDRLFTISVERHSSKGQTQDSIGKEYEKKRRLLVDQLNLQKEVLREEQRRLRDRLHDLSEILVKTREECALQVSRLALNEESLKRYRELAKNKFISYAQLSDKEQEFLDQRSRLGTLQRSVVTTQAEVMATESALRNAPLTARNQYLVIERELSSIAQESFENEARRQITIEAPRDGYVTAVQSHVGQTVSPSAVMMSIIPLGAYFEVSLFAPSKAVGFLSGGESVQIRYEAFPYQKFGQATGTIKDIARSSMTPSELHMDESLATSLYKITVALDSQEVVGFGKKMPLQEGMKLEADVMLERRRLYEWVLEPLYTITGKI